MQCNRCGAPRPSDDSGETQTLLFFFRPELLWHCSQRPRVVDIKATIRVTNAAAAAFSEVEAAVASNKEEAVAFNKEVEAVAAALNSDREIGGATAAAT